MPVTQSPVVRELEEVSGYFVVRTPRRHNEVIADYFRQCRISVDFAKSKHSVKSLGDACLYETCFRRCMSRIVCRHFQALDTVTETREALPQRFPRWRPDINWGVFARTVCENTSSDSGKDNHQVAHACPCHKRCLSPKRSPNDRLQSQVIANTSTSSLWRASQSRRRTSLPNGELNSCRPGHPIAIAEKMKYCDGIGKRMGGTDRKFLPIDVLKVG